MDDREQLKEMTQRLAGTLSVLIMELAEVRAFVRAILTSQGQIQVLLGRSEEEVTSEFEQTMTKSVSKEKTHLEESILASIERIRTL